MYLNLLHFSFSLPTLPLPWVLNNSISMYFKMNFQINIHEVHHQFHHQRWLPSRDHQRAWLPWKPGDRDPHVSALHSGWCRASSHLGPLGENETPPSMCAADMRHPVSKHILDAFAVCPWSVAEALFPLPFICFQRGHEVGERGVSWHIGVGVSWTVVPSHDINVSWHFLTQFIVICMKQVWWLKIKNCDHYEFKNV